jgi:hypothetical protein
MATRPLLPRRSPQSNAEAVDKAAQAKVLSGSGLCPVLPLTKTHGRRAIARGAPGQTRTGSRASRYLFVSLNLSMKVWVIGFPAMGSTSLRLGADILEGSFGPPPRQPFISARTTFECFEVFAIGSSMRRIHREQTCPNGVCQSLDSVN